MEKANAMHPPQRSQSIFASSKFVSAIIEKYDLNVKPIKNKNHTQKVWLHRKI
jgi:hypothetical protein